MRLGSISLLLPLLWAGTAYPAVTYPKPLKSDSIVNDFADAISAEDEARIAERASEVLSKTRIPIVVATLRSLADQGAGDWTIDRYAAGLYNDWGIGSEAGGNKGILLLVAVNDRKLRIATGAGFGSFWDGPARAIIDEVIVPRFRQGDFSQGIALGVEAIAKRLLAGAAENAPAPDSPPAGGEGARWIPRGTGVGVPAGRGGWGIGRIIFILFIVMAGFAVISVVRGLFRGGAGGRPYGGGWQGQAGGSGWGGWGGLVTVGLLGYFGSRLFDGMSRRGSGRSSGGSDSSSWGGSSGGGFPSGGGGGGGGGGSFGGGYSSGGGASGSW